MQTAPSPYVAAGMPKKTKVQSIQILNIVTEATGVSLAELMRANRKRHYVMIRFVYFYLARIYTRDSFTIIAGLIGRDHATAIYGRNLIANLLTLNDPHTHALVKKINNIINNKA
jgi:chromosomal replication initiation ATPase DnaA